MTATNRAAALLLLALLVVLVGDVGRVVELVVVWRGGW